jgi:hypothetical protein
MGYQVHITRAEDWAANEGLAIGREEWRTLVERDPQLRFSPDEGPECAIWKGAADEDEGRLLWCDGNLTAVNPNAALLGKMLELADQLNARVQGDDGRPFTAAELAAAAERAETLSPAPRRSLGLSLLALVLLLALLPAASLLRAEQAPGSPLSIIWAALAVLLLLIAVPSWIAAAAFAVGSLATGQPRRAFAWLALLVNLVSAAVFLLFH